MCGRCPWRRARVIWSFMAAGAPCSCRQPHGGMRPGRQAFAAPGEAHALGRRRLDADAVERRSQESASRRRMAARCGLIFGRSQIRVTSTLTKLPPRAATSSTAWIRNWSEEAPFQRGSVGGKCGRCRRRPSRQAWRRSGRAGRRRRPNGRPGRASCGHLDAAEPDNVAGPPAVGVEAGRDAGLGCARREHPPPHGGSRRRW